MGETPSLQAPHADVPEPLLGLEDPCPWRECPPIPSPQSHLCVPLEEATQSSPAGKPVAPEQGARDVGRSWSNSTEQGCLWGAVGRRGPRTWT